MNEISHTTITRLVVKNYRSLLDVDIALTPLTVFVGKNGVGKSNLIDVLRFVRDALRRGLDEAIDMRRGIRALRCWFADLSEHISIHLYFEGVSKQGEYGFTFGNGSHNEYELKSEQLSIRDEHHQTLFFKVYDGQLEQNGLLTGPVSKKSLYLSQLDTPSAKAVRDFLLNMSFYDLKPDGLRRPQLALHPFPLLETGENLASTLREMQKRSQDYLIMDALDVVVEGLDGYLVEDIDSHLVTKLHYTFHNGHSLAVESDLRDESDGTIRMLGILAALYQERYPSPMAIETPEKDVYSREMAVSSDVLQEAAFSYQVLVTTHSPDLINELPADFFLVVEKEDGITKIGPIISEQKDALAQQLFTLGELMQIEGLYREGASLRAKV